MQIINLFISILLSFSLNSQDNFADHMSMGLEALENNKLDISQKHFNQAAALDAESWYPLYYIAHIDITKMQMSEDYIEREALLAKAKSNIDKADKLSPNNVEIITLKANYFGGIIQLNPRENGFKYMGTVIGLYQTALAMDPENPRAHVGSIGFEIGKAKFMGQSYDASCEKLQEVIMAFDNQVIKTEYDPTHGKKAAIQLSKQCN